MKTLVILAHPNLKESKINKRWNEELIKYPDEVTVHNIYKKYPDLKIDVPEEQALVEAHNNILFQFPLYWYSYPPLLKKWIDEVLLHGWAYGSKGNKLKNKKIGTAISVGDKKSSYLPNAEVTFTLEEITAPFRATAIYIKATALPHFALFNTNQASDKEIEQSAKDYIKYINKHKSL